MKKLIFALVALLGVVGCNKDVLHNEEHKTITFVFEGEFKQVPFTKSLEADNKPMTDVWVLDYVGDELVQTIHQSDNTAEDFGNIAIDLTYGFHHLYCIATRAQNPVINTETTTFSCTKVLDTFYKDYTISVAATTSTAKNITLNRIITKLRIIFTDEIPSNATKFVSVPHNWYYSFNYVSGEVSTPAVDQAIEVNIPAASIGQTNQFMDICSISPIDLWHTDVVVKGYAGDTVIGQGTLSNVPLEINEMTQFSGPLYGTGGMFNMSLDSQWGDNVRIGSW